MTMIIDGTNGLTFNDSSTQASAGKVLQVVQVIGFTQQSTTSNTYTDMTTMSLSITPKFATSKILAIVNINGILVVPSYNAIQTRVLRGSTDISYGGAYTGYHAATGDIGYGSVVMQVLDSPATTSATTYKAQFRSSNSGSAVVVNINNSPGGNTQIHVEAANSSITLMEIAA